MEIKQTFRILILAILLALPLTNCGPPASTEPARESNPVTPTEEAAYPTPEAILPTEESTVSQTETPAPEALDAAERRVDDEDPSPTETPAENGESSPPTSQRNSLSLSEFFEVSFRDLTVRSPETVLSLGLTETYGITKVELDNISEAYEQETYAMMAEILEQLEGYDRASLSPEAQISYDVYHWYLSDQLAGQAYLSYDYPATYFTPTAVHEDLIRFFTDLHPIDNLQDARDYVTRLRQVDTKIDQLIEGLETRKQAGIHPPEFAIRWAVYGSLGQFIGTRARANILYTRLKEKVDPLSSGTPAEKQAVLDDAIEAVEDVVLPAYRDLHGYLRDYPTYAQADSGFWRLPQGEEAYTYLLAHHTTTELSADEIHQRGLDELDRIHAEMRSTFATLGYPADETLVQAYDRVARDGGRVSGNEVLTTYEDLIAEAQQNLETAFDIRPQADVVVIGDQFGGFYIPGSLDGSRPGAFYANVAGAGEPYYAMPTLAYHEAIPGHHFQISLAQEMDALPAFRQGLRFTAYTEGWALYAEQLAWELGWYDNDPYGYLGFLQAMAFRAARLVVDTGLHARGWTFSEAEAFLTANTGFENQDPVPPQQQIARYLVWPGQATSYYVGYTTLIDLRQRARDQLGEQFELKDFHRTILRQGSVPLPVLEAVVDQYIAEILASNS